jgi:uncharacterized protein DUF397
MAARIEFHTPWRKSSFSASDANCVEVAVGADAVGVRDSKDQAGPVLAVTRDSFARLLTQAPSMH